MAVIQVTSREFRDNQAAIFALADKGEKVIIKRRGKPSYLLVPVNDEDLMLSPQLEKRIEKAKKEAAGGKVTKCETKEDLHKFLEDL